MNENGGDVIRPLPREWYPDGATYDEIAAALRCDRSSVIKSYRKALRKMLAHAYESDDNALWEVVCSHDTLDEEPEHVRRVVFAMRAELRKFASEVHVLSA